MFICILCFILKLFIVSKTDILTNEYQNGQQFHDGAKNFKMPYMTKKDKLRKVGEQSEILDSFLIPIHLKR